MTMGFYSTRTCMQHGTFIDFDGRCPECRIEELKEQVHEQDTLLEKSQDARKELDTHCCKRVKELETLVRAQQDQLTAIRAGHTKTVEFDLSPAMKESAVRNKLIELGWRPPGYMGACSWPEGKCQCLHGDEDG